MSRVVERLCFIVLNGQSTRGLVSRFCGWTDPPLAANGRQAVLNLRDRLLEDRVRLPKIWYVSDRRRAIETFEILTAGMHAPVVQLVDKLREINFGHYENLTVDELPETFLREYERARSDPMTLRFPGGEGFRDLCERVSSAALEILSYEEDDSNIGIVGHQGSMRLWRMMADGLPPGAFFDEVPELGDGKWLSITVQHVGQWRRKYLAPDPQ